MPEIALICWTFTNLLLYDIYKQKINYLYEIGKVIILIMFPLNY